VRAGETRTAAARLLSGAHDPIVRVEAFKASYFPYVGADLKDYFETLKSLQPDLILTHARQDLHQDHRVVNELTWNTFRSHSILEYEIPKFDGDLGSPNVFVPLTREEVRRKCDILMECFPTQANRHWFSRETFEALARLRGVECNASGGYAEAFYGRKLNLGP
jgi:LmbE family N-acetylglucosaminyl deacetylase